MRIPNNRGNSDPYYENGMCKRSVLEYIRHNNRNWYFKLKTFFLLWNVKKRSQYVFISTQATRKCYGYQNDSSLIASTLNIKTFKLWSMWHKTTGLIIFSFYRESTHSLISKNAAISHLHVCSHFDKPHQDIIFMISSSMLLPELNFCCFYSSL